MISTGISYVAIIVILISSFFLSNGDIQDFGNHFDWSSHPTVDELMEGIRNCGGGTNCVNATTTTIVKLISVSANSHGDLLMHDIIQNVFDRAMNMLTPGGYLHSKLSHALASLSFAQGDFDKAQKYWKSANQSDIIVSRSFAAQAFLGKQESVGLDAFGTYSRLLTDQFIFALGKNSINITNLLEDSQNGHLKNPINEFKHQEDTNDLFLNMLLSEAQGVVRASLRLSDLTLASSGVKSMDAKQRFRLGVALSKIGLFELSLRHVSLSATPWEAPLYRLRAKLILPPVHKSIRALVQAVDTFETQAESILVQKIPKSPLMVPICNSLNEAALALQSLPLFHLVGVAAPRGNNAIGHSPVALPVLLSEVFVSMCQPLPMHPKFLMYVNSSDVPELSDDDLQGLDATTQDVKQMENVAKPLSKRRKNKSQLIIGIVAGSLDGITGQIVIGIIESISPALRSKVSIVAMCFPTPRDDTTDRANAVFNGHVNLPPENRTLTIERILSVKANFIIFADAILDSRVFALAHERLALWQGMLWGWGSTSGIPTIDYYFIPETLWKYSRCHFPGNRIEAAQSLFSEQVILLEGLPQLPNHGRQISDPDLFALLEDRFLLPPLNQIHIFLFPGSVKHLHPEFDSVVDIILKTDPLALIVLAVPRRGRDNMPATHLTVRHDLLHPTMPIAAVSTLKRRLQLKLGSHINRVRVLPPLEEYIYRGLLRVVSVVLDPFPVGMHVPVLEAMAAGIPVVSAPLLQECTNSHAYNFARELGLAPKYYTESSWPHSVEEYAVRALKLEKDKLFRRQLEQLRLQSPKTTTQGDQIIYLARQLFTMTTTYVDTGSN